MRRNIRGFPVTTPSTKDEIEALATAFAEKIAGTHEIDNAGDAESILFVGPESETRLLSLNLYELAEVALPLLREQHFEEAAGIAEATISDNFGNPSQAGRVIATAIRASGEDG